MAIYADDQIITVRAVNPKRPGSMARKRYAKYRSGMTVRQALDAGIRRDDFRWDTKRKFIVIR
jgi:hypothetical protein